MECEICLERFDAARRRPKVLPCGHSACLACLAQLNEKRCPQCRREFPNAAEDLLDNFYLLTVTETSDSSRIPRNRLWCTDCKRIAQQACVDDHNLKSIKTFLKDEMVQLQLEMTQLAELLPEALRLDDDDAHEQAVRALQLARQPGTTLEVSVRGQLGEAMTASWTNPPAAPAIQRGTAEHAQAVATGILSLALAKQAVWQQRGADGADAEPDQEGAAPDQEEEDQPVLQALEVGYDPTPQRRDELLQTIREQGVRRLTNVNCDEDWTWTLQLLQLAAPHLEELDVADVCRENFQAVLAMPRLMRLDLSAAKEYGLRRYDLKFKFPDELPPLPPHHVGLRRLYVFRLPRETTVNLLRMHAGTLEELWLAVGNPVYNEGGWPYQCNDLEKVLGRCGLVALRRLVLTRGGVHHTDRGSWCRGQLNAVRAVLPGVLVQCMWCDEVPEEEF